MEDSASDPPNESPRSDEGEPAEGDEARLAWAKRLRQDIARIRRGKSAKGAPGQREESPREYVERRMRELDAAGTAPPEEDSEST